MRRTIRDQNDLSIVAHDRATIPETMTNACAATDTRAMAIKRVGKSVATMAGFVGYVAAIIMPKTLIWISHFSH